MERLKGFPPQSFVQQPSILECDSAATRAEKIGGAVNDRHLLATEQKEGAVGTQEALAKEFLRHSQRIGGGLQQAVPEGAAHCRLHIRHQQLVNVEQEEGGVGDLLLAQGNKMVELMTIATTGE